jgi:hypothetical protein
LGLNPVHAAKPIFWKPDGRPEFSLLRTLKSDGVDPEFIRSGLFRFCLRDRGKGKRRDRMNSGSTPLLFSVSANWTNTERYKFGSSVGFPINWVCYTICNRECLN